MAKNGLDKWFAQKWVDIGSKKKMVHFQNVAVQNRKQMQNGSIQNASHLQKPHG